MNHTHDSLEAVLPEGYRDIEFENRMNEAAIRRCLPHVRGPTVLCLGYARDSWPLHLKERGHTVEIVEGARTHFSLAQKLDGVVAHYSTFEAFQPQRPYDSVIAGSVLEFFNNPAELLDQCRRFLLAGGQLIVTTPNALSIHRRLGALMGHESSPLAVNEAGRASGSCHLYTSHSLRELLEKTGWRVDSLFGTQVKFLASSQMREWSDALLAGTDGLADQLGMDFCKTLVAICTAR